MEDETDRAKTQRTSVAGRRGTEPQGDPPDHPLRFLNPYGGESPVLTISNPTAQEKARFLYDYCISSNKHVAESIHSLFIIAEHYASENPSELKSPEIINGIPAFFGNLTSVEKSEYCYNQVTEALSRAAHPVTVQSLIATTRKNPNDPRSSVAGRFVRRVTRFVWLTLLVLFLLYLAFILRSHVGIDDKILNRETPIIRGATWVAFGCVGALVHLLNHALTTTRLQTFDPSEERKIWPRLLLGGLFGFVLPWLLASSNLLDLQTALGGTEGGVKKGAAIGSVAAFFAGYSVRFSIGLLERLLEALMPETSKPAP